MSTILILSPHADDAEIGVGGYIAKSVKEGNTVIVVLATVGSVHFLHLNRSISADERLEEFAASMKVLGVQHTMVLTKELDSNLNTFPQGKMVGMLDQLQEKYQPDEVLIPMSSSHQDHRYCWEVGIATTRPSATKHMPNLVAAYEYPLSHWGDGATMGSFVGGLYINVEDVWETKLASLAEYKTQMREGANLIGQSGVEALAKLRGLESGFNRAELLRVLRLRKGI